VTRYCNWKTCNLMPFPTSGGLPELSRKYADADKLLSFLSAAEGFTLWYSGVNDLILRLSTLRTKSPCHDHQLAPACLAYPCIRDHDLAKDEHHETLFRSILSYCRPAFGSMHLSSPPGSCVCVLKQPSFTDKVSDPLCTATQISNSNKKILT
jgi:hypothetical protein